ncbi:hypothetical protein [Novosphingobium sp. PY1]|uniref:Uncharacterized protein n=1 Tax=Ochrobactrum sp. PW1 TaxID=1882222 RepID=A0A292GLU3_9HYPH|nr:hypothetical protein [Novosphingobium sp. PY1]BBA74445.1 hypothetical protein [Ochrobactrum sp. PW1]GFM29294.1 uncharacterized protein PY1_contig-07-220 [Novosphingobium sp. PY1]
MADRETTPLRLRDYLAFAWMKVFGTVCYLIVLPLPIPLDKPGTLRWRVMAWLWGWAYVSGQPMTVESYRDGRSMINERNA